MLQGGMQRQGREVGEKLSALLFRSHVENSVGEVEGAVVLKICSCGGVGVQVLLVDQGVYSGDAEGWKGFTKYESNLTSPSTQPGFLILPNPGG